MKGSVPQRIQSIAGDDLMCDLPAVVRTELKMFFIEVNNLGPLYTCYLNMLRRDGREQTPEENS